MTTPAGWCPDPTGHQFERCWSGGAWTEQTRAASQRGVGDGNGDYPQTDREVRSLWHRLG